SGLERPRREHAEGGAAADVGDLEPDALLSPDARRSDIAFGLQPKLLQGADRNQTRDDARRAVEVAAVADRVDMRSRHQTWRTPVRARQRHEQVGRMIAADLEAHGPGAPFDHAVAELLAGTIRVA